MSYDKTTWNNNDIIRTASMNKIENGISANDIIIQELVTNYSLLATKEELDDYATKEYLTDYVTKEELVESGIEVETLPKSSYEGKTLSILGDSISTFNGYIPSGYTAHYPRAVPAENDVQLVSDTWWWKLMDALGMVLEVNNSYSGTRVTTTFTNSQSFIINTQEKANNFAGCMSRSTNLHASNASQPDVIIIWMGINDFNNEIPLGTYDGTTPLPSITPETTITFREAYAIMLNNILTTYPYAEVWVCTLSVCERNGGTGFPEVNGDNVALSDYNKAIEELARAFGVKVLDHYRAGITYQNRSNFLTDDLHLNKYGHSIIANNDIRQIDNKAYTRYPIKE